MTKRSARTSITHGLRGVLKLLSRPVMADKGRGGLVIQAYRGYGDRTRILLMGRVFRQPAFFSSAAAGKISFDLVNVFRRIFRRGVGGVTLTARACEQEQRVTTANDGYFRLEMAGFGDGELDTPWQRVDLRVTEPNSQVTEVAGGVLIPPKECRFVVISDIDDTVVYTGVANKLKMLWRLFTKKAESRVAFPGVAALYRALHAGVSGTDGNPMLYVSRGPWSIYEVLEEFFNLHDIPVGPVLFLRDWGLTLQHPLPRRAKDHKLKLIHDMLSLYGNLPFVLIGDSGQRDPEIYARIVRENPGRVLAVLIRRIGRDATRDRDIEALARQVSKAGSHLILSADSLSMAEFAADQGLISRSAIADIVHEQSRDQDGSRAPIGHQSRGAQDVGEALEEDADTSVPQSIVVEPEAQANTPRRP